MLNMLIKVRRAVRSLHNLPSGHLFDDSVARKIFVESVVCVVRGVGAHGAQKDEFGRECGEGLGREPAASVLC